MIQVPMFDKRTGQYIVLLEADKYAHYWLHRYGRSENERFMIFGGEGAGVHKVTK